MILTPNRAPSAIAMVPMPLVPPWTRAVSPSVAKARSNKLVHTVNNVSGIAAASTIDKRRRHGQALADRRGGIFGIAAAGEQGADRLADELGRNPLAGRGDRSGHFQPRNGGRAGRHRVEAAPLQHVGAVDPGGGDPDEQLARARARHRPADRNQHFGSARPLRIDRGHLFRNVSHLFPFVA